MNPTTKPKAKAKEVKPVDATPDAPIPHVHKIIKDLEQWQEKAIRDDILPRTVERIDEVRAIQRKIESVLAGVNFWCVETEHILNEKER